MPRGAESCFVLGRGRGAGRSGYARTLLSLGVLCQRNTRAVVFMVIFGQKQESSLDKKEVVFLTMRLTFGKIETLAIPHFLGWGITLFLYFVPDPPW